MLKKILAVLAAIGGFFSAVFFVLFKQAKLEQKIEQAEEKARLEEERAENIRQLYDIQTAVHKTIADKEKEDAEKKQKMQADNTLDSFNAGLELLRDKAESGQKRNSADTYCRH